MLEHLKKFFKPEEEVTMSEKDKAPLELANNEANVALAALQASFDEQASQLVAALESVASLQASLESFQAAAAQAKADAHKVKMSSRLAAVEANLGTDKAPAFMEATKELDDTAFAAICSAMAGTLKAEAESELFKEVGVETKAEATVEVKPVHFNKFIKKD